MRTLKKSLALVLALVMVVGLLTIGAGAAFTDDEDIQYKEAVDVMVGIGAINGYEDGSFRPQGNITRAEAAKMVTYAILGPNVASMLPTKTSSFTDMAGYSWAIPYIEYCVSKGIINGVGGGKFEPAGNVTGFQLAKMLLCAAGYGQADEYVGSQWSLNVAIDAFANGIFAGSKVTDFSLPATREEAALYVFNGITKVATVNYSKSDVVYETVPNTSPTQTYADDGKLQIAEKVYPTLKREKTLRNGIDGYVWTLAGAEISDFVANETVLGTSYDGTAIADLTTKGNKKFIAQRGDNVEYYFNGVQLPTGGSGVGEGGKFVDGTVIKEIRSGSVKEYALKVGSIVNLIDLNNDKKVDKVSIIEKKVAKVSADIKTRTFAGEQQVNIPGVTSGFVNADTVNYPADLAKDDVVLYVDLDGVRYVEKAAASDAGKFTAKAANNDITVGGVTYKPSGLDGADFSKMALGTDYVIYTDNDGGYAVAYSTVSAAKAQYALVLDVATVTAIGQPPVHQAQLLFMDGSKEIVTVTEDWSKKGAGSTTTLKGKLISYTVNKNGEYVFVAAASDVDDATIKNKQVKVADGMYATNDTIFLVRYGKGTPADPYTYTTYTGYTNVPTLADETVSLFADNGKVAIVYVDEGTPGAANAFVYLLSDTSYGLGYADGVEYREYPAIVNGELGTVKTVDKDSDGDEIEIEDIFANGPGLYEVDMPGNGIITVPSGPYAKKAAYTVGDIIGNGIIELKDKDGDDDIYTYDENTKVFYIDNTGTLQVVLEVPVNYLTKGNSVNITLVPGTESTTKLLSAIYIWVPKT